MVGRVPDDRRVYRGSRGLNVRRGLRLESGPLGCVVISLRDEDGEIRSQCRFDHRPPLIGRVGVVCHVAVDDDGLRPFAHGELEVGSERTSRDRVGVGKKGDLEVRRRGNVARAAGRRTATAPRCPAGTSVRGAGDAAAPTSRCWCFPGEPPLTLPDDPPLVLPS